MEIKIQQNLIQTEELVAMVDGGLSCHSEASWNLFVGESMPVVAIQPKERAIYNEEQTKPKEPKRIHILLTLVYPVTRKLLLTAFPIRDVQASGGRCVTHVGSPRNPLLFFVPWGQSLRHDYFNRYRQQIHIHKQMGWTCGAGDLILCVLVCLLCHCATPTKRY